MGSSAPWDDPRRQGFFDGLYGRRYDDSRVDLGRAWRERYQAGYVAGDAQAAIPIGTLPSPRGDSTGGGAWGVTRIR